MLHATSLPCLNKQTQPTPLTLFAQPLTFASNAYISRLDDELHVVTRAQLDGVVRLGKVEKDLLHHIGTLNKPERVLHRADHPAVLHRMGRILQPDMAGSQVAPTREKKSRINLSPLSLPPTPLLPLIGGNLKADLVASPQRDVPLDVVFGIRKEEALAPVLIANPAGRGVARTRQRQLRLQLGGNRPGDALLRQDHLRRNLRHLASDGLPRATIVRHLELNRVANLQMLDGAPKLGKVEKQPGLALAALNKPVRMLQQSNKNNQSTTTPTNPPQKSNPYQQLLDDSGLAGALIVSIPVAIRLTATTAAAAIVPVRVPRTAPTVRPVPSAIPTHSAAHAHRAGVKHSDRATPHRVTAAAKDVVAGAASTSLLAGPTRGRFQRKRPDRRERVRRGGHGRTRHRRRVALLLLLLAATVEEHVALAVLGVVQERRC